MALFSMAHAAHELKDIVGVAGLTIAPAHYYSPILVRWLTLKLREEFSEEFTAAYESEENILNILSTLGEAASRVGEMVIADPASDATLAPLARAIFQRAWAAATYGGRRNASKVAVVTFNAPVGTFAEPLPTRWYTLRVGLFVASPDHWDPAAPELKEIHELELLQLSRYPHSHYFENNLPTFLLPV